MFRVTGSKNKRSVSETEPGVWK